LDGKSPVLPSNVPCHQLPSDFIKVMISPFLIAKSVGCWASKSYNATHWGTCGAGRDGNWGGVKFLDWTEERLLTIKFNK